MGFSKPVDVLTADPPFAAIHLIDIGNDRTHNEPRDISRGIEQTDRRCARVAKILIPCGKSL
jgi:hypothetical protein